MTTTCFDQSYIARCSEKTLQTNKNGFFSHFSQNLVSIVGQKWIKEVFGKLTTDRDRIKLVYAHKELKEAICTTLGHVQEIYRKKNAQVSYTRRKEAEVALESNDLHKSLLLCSQAVMRAPQLGEDPRFDDGFTLAQALWSRSTVLIKMKKYSWALRDLQAALKEGIPDDLKFEAYWKMGICYKGVGDNNKAKIAFGLAEKLSGNNKNVERNDMEKQYEEDKDSDHRIMPNISHLECRNLPGAFKKLTIGEDPGKGKYIMAAGEIKTGETVVVEAPYASCLFPDCFGTHCHHCFDRLVAPVGCSDCSSVAFCKSECRDIAVKTYHKYECHFLDLLIGSGMSVLCHLAFRMITQNKFQKVLEIYRDRSQLNIYGLCTNARLRTPEDLFQRCLMTAFLLRCLQKSEYFCDGEGNENIVPNEEELKVAELLYFHLQMLQFNAHEIYETRYEKVASMVDGRPVSIGVGVYPTSALFNHDCYPSVARHFVGRTIVITAVRPLSPGEMIGENYGPSFTRASLKERQKSLASRYWFKCQCQACIQDWPSLGKGLENVSTRLRCVSQTCDNIFTLPLSKTVLRCPRCEKKVSMASKVTDMKNFEEMCKNGIEMVKNNEREAGMKALCNAIDTFHRISSCPHYQAQMAEEYVKKCLVYTGNVFVVPRDREN